MAQDIHIDLDQVASHFENLEDPRSEINRKHPLVSVIVIALMGVLAGCNGPSAIAEWAQQKEDFLLQALSLPHGLPKKDVFRRVLSALKPEAFQACFVNWLQALKQTAMAAAGVEQPIYAVDGKTLRRSHNKQKGLGALHSVSVWATEFGLTLAQVATDEKSNEITAIPELLKLVDIQGAIITIDAMGTQTKIAKQIVDGGGDYVLQLKGNQAKAHQHVIDHIQKHVENDFAEIKARQHVTTEKGHGREETRVHIQMPAPKDMPGFSKWKALRTIGVIYNICLRDGKETIDARYYLSSLRMGVKQFARAARGHWGIENGCHWEAVSFFGVGGFGLPPWAVFCFCTLGRPWLPRGRLGGWPGGALAGVYLVCLTLLSSHCGRQVMKPRSSIRMKLKVMTCNSVTAVALIAPRTGN